MTNTLIPDENIPQQFKFGACEWMVAEKRNMHYYRVLAFPIFGTGDTGGGYPRWFSNVEIKSIADEIRIK